MIIGGDNITIHVVREGDTLYGIGKLYNVDYRKIASDNEIPIHQTLVVGQTLVIITDSFKKFREIEVNGYAFPNINRNILKKVLPSLTYLSIFSYQVDDSGNLNTINDDELISIAKNNRVVPIMVITNIGMEGRFNSDIAHIILNNENIQNKLITNVLNIMHQEGYGGLNIDFEYVYPQDRDAYTNFIRKVKNAIKNDKYLLIVSVAPKTSDEQKGLLYEAHDYKSIGELADRVVIMTYEWGYSGGPSMAVAPIDKVKKVIDYAVRRIPSNKTLMGIPNYGYDWALPYMKGNLAKVVGNYRVVDLARNHHQFISYNYEDQTPYFNYFDPTMVEHEVWFEDARSIQAKLELVIKYNLIGISYWTISRLFPQNYLVLNSLFTIKKY